MVSCRGELLWQFAALGVLLQLLTPVKTVRPSSVV